MSTRMLSVLAAITVALFAYVLVFERGSVTSKELSQRAGRVLPSFVREKVERITVQRKGIDVVLERDKGEDGLGNFSMIEPLKARADADAVDKLLGELEWLSARRTVDDDKRYGVENPRLRVTYVAGGETHVLAVGNDDVHGEALYVRVDREPKLAVVPKSLLDVIDHDPGYFRDKELFPELTVAWAVKLEIRGAPRTHTFVKEAGHWWLGQASDKRYADEKKLGDLLSTLSGLRAAREVEPSQRTEAERALAQPTMSVVVAAVPDETREDKKASAQSLEVGSACGTDARYAKAFTVGKDDARLVCVSNEALKPFELGEIELAEPRLFRAPPNEVQRFVITRGKDQLAWRREGSGWKSDVDAPADTANIESWLRELSAARALRSAPLHAFEERGRLRLELVNDRHEELTYGALTAEGVLVHRGDESLVLTFPASVFDRLAAIRTRFSPLKPWAGHQPSEVVRFEAQYDGKRRTGELVEGAWRSDVERVRELVRELIALEPIAYLSNQARPEHGLGNGKLVFGLRDGKSLTLELGAHTDHGAYARIGEDLYEVGSGTLAELNELAGGARAQSREEEDSDDDHEH